MSNVKINIYGGIQQIIPDAEEMSQTFYTKDGKTVVVNNIITKKPKP